MNTAAFSTSTRVVWPGLLVALAASLASGCAVDPVPTPGKADKSGGLQTSADGGATADVFDPGTGKTDAFSGGSQDTPGGEGADGTQDGGVGDAEPAADAQPDAGSTDAGSTDAGSTDAGPGDGQPLSDGGAPPDGSGGADAASDAADAQQPAVEWTHFRYAKGAGPCPPKVICSWTWDVGPDGKVETSKQGKKGGATLSAADLATLDGVLSDKAFVDKMKNGFTCGTPPSDVGMSFKLTLPSAVYGQSVTGCAFAGGGDGPVVQKVIALLTAY